jgi:hypothetical protein
VTERGFFQQASASGNSSRRGDGVFRTDWLKASLNLDGNIVKELPKLLGGYQSSEG